MNVTPDSYFDGGKYVEVERAVKRAAEMLADGADIIEIGGESTGPGSREIFADEEVERIIPVVSSLRKLFPKTNISVDTWKSKVAAEALSMGVSMINDVTAGRGDPEMFRVLSKSDCKVVLMYAKDPSARTTIEDRPYENVVRTVKSFLEERIEAALASGISRDRIILDPGMGHFVSSDPRYSYELLARLQEIVALGFPVLLSPSRKSFLAGRENLSVSDRLPGTIAASSIAVMNGATYIRTHDVLEVRRGCEMAEAVARASRA